MELIDKKETIRLLAKCRDSEPVHSDVSFGIKAGVDKAMIVISNFADVVEERKHGHWINGYKCSVCGMHRAIDNGVYRMGTKDNKYCFRCGATMDEEV